MKFTLYGRPITKKNSQRIVTVNGHSVILPSRAYTQYEKDCLEQIWLFHRQFNTPERVNLKCVYFMPTRHRVDLANLIEATQDILVKAKVLPDDNCRVVVSLDGCRVADEPDKENPRVEIELTEMP